MFKVKTTNFQRLAYSITAHKNILIGSVKQELADEQFYFQ